MIWCVKTYNFKSQNTHTKKDILSIMSNLQPNCCLKFDFQKVDQHAIGKWLIHDTKRRKDNQLQSLKLPCRISKLSSLMWHKDWKELQTAKDSFLQNIKRLPVVFSLDVINTLFGSFWASQLKLKFRIMEINIIIRSTQSTRPQLITGIAISIDVRIPPIYNLAMPVSIRCSVFRYDLVW